MKNLFINDDRMSDFGGASATLSALMDENSEFANLADLSILNFDKFNNIIFGNFYVGAHQVDLSIFNNFKGNIFKVEFDYNFCKFRSPILKSIQDPSVDPFSGSEPLKNYYDFLKNRCKKFFFMSALQASIYEKLINLNTENNVILSSYISKSHLEYLNNLRDSKKTNKSAVVDAANDNQRALKGVGESMLFCRINNIEFDLIYDIDYLKFLEKLSGYSRLVFLPNNLDTCPRLLIEARILGLEVITNQKSQHVFESWWSLPSDELCTYISGRKDLFWQKIYENPNNNLSL